MIYFIQNCYFSVSFILMISIFIYQTSSCVIDDGNKHPENGNISVASNVWNDGNNKRPYNDSRRDSGNKDGDIKQDGVTKISDNVNEQRKSNSRRSDGNRKLYEDNIRRYDGTSKRYDGNRKRYDGNSRRYDGNRKRYDDNSRRYDGNSKRYDGNILRGHFTPPGAGDEIGPLDVTESYLELLKKLTTVGRDDKYSERTTYKSHKKRTTPFRVSLEEDCDYLAYYCLKAYKTGPVCGRTLYYNYQNFKNYCMLDYVNCMERYEVWQIVHMGDCINITRSKDYQHYEYQDDFFLDQVYVIQE